MTYGFYYPYEFHWHMFLPKIITWLHNKRLDLIGRIMTIRRKRYNFLNLDLPFGTKIWMWKYKAFLFIWDFIWLLILWLFFEIFLTDCLEYYLKRYSFFCRESDAVTVRYIHRHTRILLKRQQYAWLWWVLFVKFIMNFLQFLP